MLNSRHETMKDISGRVIRDINGDRYVNRDYKKYINE